MMKNKEWQRYQQWLADPLIDASTKQELRQIEGDLLEIQDRFYRDLEFGTAGLRGILGAGTNRMNFYTVGMATQALAQVILEENPQAPTVAIAYDCRLFSEDFARYAACVLSANGIGVYLFDSLRPTPELSFAVRHHRCAAGINITASHNPKNYNGYKVYWKEGSQIKDDIADRILAAMQALPDFSAILQMPYNQAVSQGFIRSIGQPTDEAFLEQVLACSLRQQGLDLDLSVIYTPLHGAGARLVPETLRRKGYREVRSVYAQTLHDGTFPTVEYPNPEDPAAFAHAKALSQATGADLLIATDPDCDRVAAMVPAASGYVALTGNQVGILLVEYLLSSLQEIGRLPKNGLIVKSIVTGEMTAAICARYGVEMISVLTGFKNICALANHYEKTQEKQFLMGFEESIGYCFGTFVRDKDAVTASLLLVEAAAYYKKQGQNLLEVLDGLYKQYGYQGEKTLSLVFPGAAGQARIGRMMDAFRSTPPFQVGGYPVKRLTDYQKALWHLANAPSQINPTGVEPTDALRFDLEDGSWFALRPSGTEPKIKLYLYSKAQNKREAEQKIQRLEQELRQTLEAIS